jgi:uncharacterized protein (DUF305 family)
MKMQPEKGNKMMMEMHEMMDTINVVPAPGDPDHHFAIMMKMHHEGAIKMADIVLKEGSNTVIKRIAQLMIQKQNDEIALLEGFLEGHISGPANQEFNMKMDTCLDKIDHDDTLQLMNGTIDHDFAAMMIAHHQSAIAMADLIICYGHNASIQRLAREIKEDQETEVAEFQKWLAMNNTDQKQ